MVDLEDVRRLIREEHRPRATISWPGVLLALAVPTVVALLAAGRLLTQIDDDVRAVARQEEHLGVTDGRVTALERDVAVLAERVRRGQEGR